MKIRKSSLTFKNVISAKIQSNNDEWREDIKDFKELVTRSGVYPVGRALKNLMFFKCGYPQSKKIVNEAEVFSFINYFYLVIYIITRIFLP